MFSTKPIGRPWYLACLSNLYISRPWSITTPHLILCLAIHSISNPIWLSAVSVGLSWLGRRQSMPPSIHSAELIMAVLVCWRGWWVGYRRLSLCEKEMSDYEWFEGDYVVRVLDKSNSRHKCYETTRCTAALISMHWPSSSKASIHSLLCRLFPV